MSMQTGATERSPVERAPRRNGRPPKSSLRVPTTDRLLSAATDVFVEHGFGGATVTEIARRAGISGPAAYKHFDTKADLLVAAAKRGLRETTSGVGAAGPHEIARRWMSPEFASTRRLMVELHLAAGRESEVFDLLSAWHHDQSSGWVDRRGDSPEQVKAFFLLLLGLAQLDALSSLPADDVELGRGVDRMIDALFDAGSMSSDG
ncbi:TetR/AcrR family transcriptional regulator [Ilumatobacter sp.]|uniref:TetR/AcrR family transcriptional regulator n=1 Tax=Ilumatobacter sp. TaxID=1967498 RepID=UPI003C4C29EF